MHSSLGVVWLTGLPAAGKTTIASALTARLRLEGHGVELLDGDAIRDVLPCGFSRPERERHVKTVAFLAGRLEHHGVTPVVALISPYRDSRACARSLCRRFIEVHVATALEECLRRDPKGLYAAARAGRLRDVTGVDAPYEPPLSAEVTIDTVTAPVDVAVERILERLRYGQGDQGATVCASVGDPVLRR